MSSDKTEKLYLDCECEDEVLKLVKTSETQDFSGFPVEFVELWISIYSLRKYNSFWNKLKFCWKYLIGTKDMFQDQIILRNNNITKLKEFLNNNFKQDV
jgi:hypothetical protein